MNNMSPGLYTGEQAIAEEMKLRHDHVQGRWGEGHTLRNETPAIHPEVLDFMDRKEREEAIRLAELAAQSSERRAQIAVADTVEVRFDSYAS